MKKWIIGLLMAAALPQGLLASERHFGFSYESPVLKEDARELETYVTYSFGKDHFFSALEERMEFEWGLGSGIQTSLYLNFKQEMEDQGLPDGITNEFLADGISSEWKFKLTDSAADFAGIGLYAELKFAPDAFEIETKLILDKKIGDFLGTLNLTAEPEFSFIANTPTVWKVTPSLGAGYFLSNHFFLGVEAVAEIVYDGDPAVNIQSTLAVGPVFSYTSNNWWITLSALPQVANLLGGDLDLVESQGWQIRLANAWSL